MAMAGFEKLADLRRRIAEGEAKARTLWGSGPGTPESDLLRQTMKRVEELKKEQRDLRGLLTRRGEPDYDPVAAVGEKYAGMGTHNRRIALLRQMANHLAVLSEVYVQLQLIERPSMPRSVDGVPLYTDPIFVNFQWNIDRQLARLTPMTQEGFEAELKAALELVERLRREADEHEAAEKAVAAI